MEHRADYLFPRAEGKVEMRVFRNGGGAVRAPSGHYVDDQGELFEEVSEEDAEALEESGVEVVLLARSADLEDDDDDE